MQIEMELCMKSIYVGNIPFSATEDQVRELFSKFGAVKSAKIIMDRETNRPKGFAFVEMEDTEAQNAINSLNNTDFLGRSIRVNEARQRENRN